MVFSNGRNPSVIETMASLLTSKRRSTPSSTAWDSGARAEPPLHHRGADAKEILQPVDERCSSLARVGAGAAD
jgi:hypothetical protein